MNGAIFPPPNPHITACFAAHDDWRRVQLKCDGTRWRPLTFGSGSSVGIATYYGLEGPGSNPGGEEIFRPSRPALRAHPASCKMGTGSFPGGKVWPWGVLLTTHPLLVPRSWKSRAIPLPIPLGHTGPVTGSLYLYFYLTCVHGVGKNHLSSTFQNTRYNEMY